MKILLIVLANDHRVYDVGRYTVAMKDEYESITVNENNFDDFRGYDVEALTFIGDCSKENIDKFLTLIR